MKSQLVALATLVNFCAIARPPQLHPTASVGPGSVTFATQPTGTTSPAQTVTLTNTGAASLSINGISISGANAGGFGFTTACGSNLAVGATCAIDVNFTPALVGTETASLVISDNSSSGATQSIALSGTGQAPLSYSVTLSWTPSVTTDVSLYDIYRCLGSACTPNQDIGSVPAGTTSLTDASVTKGSTYTYAVSAVDASGQSALSHTATAMIPNTGYSVALSWTPSVTTDVSSYNIYRCLGSGCTPNQDIGSVPAGTTSLTDAAVTNGSTYTYAVTANDTTGQSALSVRATAVIPN